MNIRDLTLIALFPALLGATAGISIPLGGLPAITLQTIFVFLAALILGPKKGFISIAVYILIGLIGIPIFAGYKGGLVVFTTVSGGFIIGFLFSVILIGIMKNINFIINSYLPLFAILVLGNFVLYVSGAAYITLLTNAGFISVLAGLAIFIPGDLIKIMVVIYVYKRIRPFITYV